MHVQARVGRREGADEELQIAVLSFELQAAAKWSANCSCGDFYGLGEPDSLKKPQIQQLR